MLEGADVVICSVDKSDLQTEEDFEDTRMAGLINQYTSKFFIFTVDSPDAETNLANLSK